MSDLHRNLLSASYTSRTILRGEHPDSTVHLSSAHVGLNVAEMLPNTSLQRVAATSRVGPIDSPCADAPSFEVVSKAVGWLIPGTLPGPKADKVYSRVRGADRKFGDMTIS